MRIAIVTFDGFNEIDSFVALYVLDAIAPGAQGVPDSWTSSADARQGPGR